jgi:hypothetical protein
MTDLLDLLNDLAGVSDYTHVLMPCMAYACGGDIVSKGGHFQVGINDWSAVSCPDCRALDPDALRVEMRRQQGAQA